MHLSSSLMRSFPSQTKCFSEKVRGTVPATTRGPMRGRRAGRGAMVGKARAAGFTLLELMAVILIIGIIVSFATLSIGQNTSRIVQDEVERLHGLIRLAGEESVLQGRELALEFNRDKYQFLEWDGEAYQPIEEDKMFRERELPETIEVKLMLEDVEASFEDKKNLPRIFILSSGELTPFDLTLSIDDAEEYSLQGQFNGKLVLTRAEDDES